MSQTEYEARLAADRTVTMGGSVSWQAPRPEAKTGSVNTQRTPAADYELPNGAAARAAAMPTNMTALQKACIATQHAADKHRELVGQLKDAHHDPCYTDQNIQNVLNGFADSPAMRDVEHRLSVVEEQVALAEQVVEKTRAQISQPGDAAAEQRNTRYWHRVQRQLDAVKDGDYLGRVDKIIGEATPEQVGVLFDELAPYLESRGSSTAWLDDRFAAASPKYGEAKKLLETARQGLSFATGIACAVRESGGNAHIAQYDPRYDFEV